jgi:hypothetical protein
MIGIAIAANKIRAMRDDRSSESLRAILKWVWTILRATPNRDQISPNLYRAKLDRPLLQQIKQCRRIAARYDKLAANFLALIKLASIRIWPRANEFEPWLSDPRSIFATQKQQKARKHRFRAFAIYQ